MSFNNLNSKEAENYFEDFDAAPIDEDGPYDDDETFGDTGPLNDEWENNHNLLQEEHETFLNQNKLRDSGKGLDNGIDSNGQEDEEEEEEEDYSSYQQSRFTNGRDVRHFTQSSTTTTTTTTTTRINNNNYEDDNINQLDDQMESVFKIAMGEAVNNQDNNNINKMMELMGSVSMGNNKNNSISSNIVADLPTKGMSLSDIEAKLFEQQQAQSAAVAAAQLSTSENTQQQTTNTTTTAAVTTSSPTTTPTKTVNVKNNNGSPRTSNANVHNNITINNNTNINNRYPRSLTLGDMIGGKQQNQQNQQAAQQAAQQAQQQSQPSPRKYINKNQNTKNSGDKKYMTAEEIQTINRLQAYQIHFTNPFIEDYYYQRYKIKQSGPTHSHTPICDSTPKTAPSPKKPIGNTSDPLTGALGRIPSHSIRAPRQILQVILNNDEEAQNGNGEEKNQNSDPTIKLIIESAYNHILDLEDIKELISNTSDQTLLQEYQTKQEPVSRELFKSLYLDPFPSFKFESPTLPTQEVNQKWPSVCHEDLLFVSLWVFAKGRKLLKRAFPLLSDKQSLSGLFAVCRNLPLLLLLHLPEGSEQSTEEIYKSVQQWIMDVPIKFFILGFHFLVNFNQSKFIVKLFQTKEGLSIINSFLTRGFLIYDQIYLAQNQLQLDPMDREQWRDVFDRFFQRITGSFQSIFPLTQQPSMELSQIFQLLMGHCNEQQTQIFHIELNAGQQQPQQFHHQSPPQFHQHPPPQFHNQPPPQFHQSPPQFHHQSPPQHHQQQQFQQHNMNR